MKRFFIIFFLFILLGSCIYTIYSQKKVEKKLIPPCGDSYIFDEFVKMKINQKDVKSISDRYIYHILEINKYQDTKNLCSSGISGRDSCVQYFDTKSAAGGSILVCINRRAGSLVSVEFEQ